MSFTTTLFNTHEVKILSPCDKTYYYIIKYCKKYPEYNKCQDLLEKYKNMCGKIEGVDTNEDNIFLS